jgi:hypothetical protein
MNFLEYIKTLSPVFGKTNVTKSCELSQTSLSQHTIPAYASASTLWKGQKFKSETTSDYVKWYEKSVGLNRTENMFTSIHLALVNGLTILNLLSDTSKNSYSESEANISMTYFKTTVVKIIESCEFASTYARKLLNYIYFLETEVVDVDHGSSPSPAEIKWIKDGFMDFCLCINTMKLDPKIIENHLNNLPNATVTELTEKTFSTTIGMNKMDPMNLRHLSARINPFYLIGMWVAEYQAEKYKTAKAELELLQLRKYNLEKQLEKTPDAKLEKEIAYMQNRVTGMIYKVNKMEDSYGV